MEDAAKDNVRYMELRFTPVALSRAERFPLHDVIDWVMTSAKDAARKYDVIVRLIASVNRHESPELAEQVAWLAADLLRTASSGWTWQATRRNFHRTLSMGIFKEARQAGLHVTIHAGEWGPAAMSSEAIEDLGAERIGHGVRVVEDSLCRRFGSRTRHAFEVCVTSNYQSGVVHSPGYTSPA